MLKWKSKMNKNTIILITTLGIFLIIGAAYFMFPTTPHKDKLKDLEKETKINEKEENKTPIRDYSLHIIENKSELNLTAKLPFKVGDKFEYRAVGRSVDATDVYIVEEIKNIDGRDYYVIRTKSWGKQRLYGDKWVEIPKGEGGVWLHYDKETQEAFEMINGKLRYLGVDPMLIHLIHYWKLALRDNFKWERRVITHGLGLESRHVYEVVGREKIKGRECFKVEKKHIDVKTGDIGEVIVYWIDVETRVPIREIWYENYEKKIIISEENLVSAPFPLSN